MRQIPQKLWNLKSSKNLLDKPVDLVYCRIRYWEVAKRLRLWFLVPASGVRIPPSQ